jgi:uncharacterized protein (DUF4415 family)
MNKRHDEIRDQDVDTMRDDYSDVLDWSKGEIGKYHVPGRTTILMRIDEDVAEYFSTSTAVNAALRQLIAEGRVPDASAAQ